MLTLSNPFGPNVSDGQATGTIENDDPMPMAWLARFGRTVGSQAVDAVTTRLEAGGRVATSGGSTRRLRHRTGCSRDRSAASSGVPMTEPAGFALGGDVQQSHLGE